jgi:hypothetical protein
MMGPAFVPSVLRAPPLAQRPLPYGAFAVQDGAPTGLRNESVASAPATLSGKNKTGIDHRANTLEEVHG